MSNERFRTLAEVEEELNCSMSQIYSLVRSGDLKGIQIGGRNQWRVERTKLEEYILNPYNRIFEGLRCLALWFRGVRWKVGGTGCSNDRPCD